MLHLMLERAGLIERTYQAWDVLVKQPIPAAWVESVRPKDDPAMGRFVN